MPNMNMKFDTTPVLLLVQSQSFIYTFIYTFTNENNIDHF